MDSTPEFRQKIKRLRDLGLIGQTNLRKAEPNWIRSGHKLSELIDKYDDVLSGKAAVIPVDKLKDPTANRKLYERVRPAVKSKPGAKVKRKEFIIVPHSADEKVKLQNGRVVITHPVGIDRVQVPVEYHNLKQWLNDTAKAKIQKGRGQKFAFRFYGGSSAVYSDIKDLLADLTKYTNVEQAIADNDKSAQQDLYRNIEIVTVHSTKDWFKSRESNKKKSRSKRKRRKRRK